MKSTSATLKKAAAGVLSAAMLLTTLFSALPVSAKSAMTDNGGFYVPYANTDIYTKYTDSDPNKPGVNTAYDANGEKTGVHLTFNGGNFTKRVVSAAKYNFDDFSIRFNNLKKTEGHESEDLAFCVMFGSSDENMPELRLLFDTKEGTVAYFSGTVTPQLMATDDLLKYDSLSANEFNVSLDILSDGIVCGVKVGNSEPVEGFITDTNYTGLLPANIASYLVLGPGREGDYYFSVDVTGIKCNQYTRPTNAAFVGGITDLNGQGTNIAIVNYLTKFPQARTISFAAGKDIGARATSAAKVTVDGISLKFDSLNTSGTNYPQFTVCLMDDAATGMPRIRVMIDTADGTVKYWAAADTPAQLGQSDLLKYETLSQSEFTYTFNYLESGDAKVTIKVGESDAVVGTLPNSYLTKYYTNISGESQVYYCFGPGKATDRDAFSVRYTGYRQTRELTYIDGDVTKTAIVTAGESGITAPAIELGKGYCHAYWLSGNIKYTQNGNVTTYTANSDAVFTAVRRAYGDVNDDGNVNTDDMVNLRKHLLGADTSFLAVAADVTDDGQVSVLDLIRMKKYFAGLEVVFGPNE